MERYTALIETPIGADICRHLENQSAIFVFPSQESANSWAEALVKSSACRVVALDRFFGFEHFLRHCTALREHGAFRTLQPVDTWAWAIEALTARETSPENALSLTWLLPSTEVSTSQVSRLVGLIPSLYEVEALQKGRVPAFPYGFLQEEFEELTLLARHYRNYLDQNHLLDGHLAPLVLPPGIEVHAYGLRADFARLGFAGGVWESSGGGARLVFPDVADNTRTIDNTSILSPFSSPYYEFDSFLSEIETVLTEISTAISQGYEPEDIAISVCRLNGQKAAWIRQTAEAFRIPVSVRWGEPLSLTVFGRLLQAIQSASREGLTLDSIDAFCAVESIKSRNPGGWNTLRHTALRAHIPSPSPDADYVHRLWKESEQIGLCMPECAQMYERLWQDICGITRAESFSRLYEQVLIFLEHWVDTSRFSADIHTDRSMRMALDELQSWMERETTLRLGPFMPFELYMTALSAKSYIPLLEENAVRVYDFRTASALASAVQYVIGASHTGLAPSLGNPSALPPELSAIVVPKVETDIGEFLAMHSIGHTAYSFAREGLEGYEVAHPLFGPPSKKAAKTMHPLRPSRDSPGESPRNPPERTARTHSYSNPYPVDPKVSNRFLQATQSFDFEKMLVVFSPHSLKDRARCAFRWFAQRIDLVDIYSNDDMARIVGDFLHATYQRTIQSLSQHPSEAEDPALFGKAFETAARTTLTKIFAEYGPGVRPSLQTLIDRTRHRLEKLWDFERKTFQGYTRKGFEVQVSSTFEREGALLHGRIDCVFSRTDESLGNTPCYIIVDYKKNRIPFLSEMKIRAQKTDRDELESQGGTESEDSGEGLGIEEIQLPSYALMLEMSGGIVEGALYWSIEKAEPVAYLRPPAAVSIRSAYTRREDTGPVRAAMLDMLASAAGAVRRGELLDPAPDREACNDCPYKPLCRYWYFLEL
ncbi:MAG: PD-(D/E)XK nuclease family protein [Rectinema sp.]